MTASMNPSILLPPSPMKILAGGKLYSRKPREAPARLAARKATAALPCRTLTTVKKRAEIADIPAHEPSEWSSRFTELVIPTSHSSVTGAARSERPEPERNRLTLAPSKTK